MAITLQPSILKYKDNQGNYQNVGAVVGNTPPGGTAGQVLTKVSGTDYDMEWSTYAPVYTFIRYASVQPTQDSDMSTTPGPWMGVYSGSSATAPEHYVDYTWNKVEGPQGLAFTFEDNGTGLILKPLKQEA